MPSSWIVTRPTKDGQKRYRVEYRLGGRESATGYGGSFKTKREADERRRWIGGELAGRRLPELRSLKVERAPTLAQAADNWRASRVDVGEQTAHMHRSAFVRIFRVKPALRARHVDEITRVDIAGLIAELAAAGYRRETVRKTRTALAQTLDFYGVTPNPARDDRVKLPRERKTHLPPPLAEHVERVLGLVARTYRLPLAILDVTGPV